MSPKQTKTKRVKKIRGFAVLQCSAPYHPADWLRAYTIFKSEKEAKYWKETRVHPSNTRPKIVECTIEYKLPIKKK